jgi:predicted MPP superfamily phosphohydrolase
MLIPAIAATAVVGLSLLAYARFVEPAWLRIRYRRVSIPGWHVAAEADGSPGLRILHLSDLHVGRSTGRIHRFIERAAAIPADIVAITGDFVDHPQYLPQLSEVLRSITGGDRPVLAVMGNHDRFAYEKRLVRSNPHAYNSGELIETVRALGIDLLIDELRTVPTRVGDITFVGVDLRSHDTEGLTRALGGHTGDGVVMLAHSPDAIHAAVGANIGLLLCGHTHGGQVRISPWLTPLTSTRTPIKPPSGLSLRGKTTMHVSLGLGVTFLPLRFFSRPEATLIEIVPNIP